MVLATLPLGPDANVVRDLGVSGDRIRVRAEAGLVSNPVLVPVRPVPPSTWKKALGLSADKNASRQRAIETWPEHVRTFARVRDDGRAEAALLALFGARP